VTGDGGDLFCPLEYRYGRDELRSIFSRRARLERALRVEAALALAEADEGMIPRGDADAIARASASGSVTVEEVDALERETRHDVMAITRALARAAGPAGRWVHYGATSADITETALALELVESMAILREDVTHLIRELLRLARLHRATPELGRTHGQQAVPISFGYKMAVAAAEFERHRRRLDELRPRLAVGKMAGAVGTGAGFGEKSEAIEANVMHRLKLVAADAPIQIIMRDRLAEFTNWLALVASSTERLSTELRNLQRTEIGEVAEPFDERRQVGSSTMAQKRNPIVAENITSLSRLVRSFAIVPLENMVQWHERDLSNSANERIVLPHAIVLMDDVLTKLTQVVHGLEVRPDRMAQNLKEGGGAEMTESLMLALTSRGMARSEAHELLRRITHVGTAGASLSEQARADATVLRYLTPKEIDELLDSQRYVNAAARKTDRVVERLTKALES
jgi:adenylosuccinate lyase